MLLQVDTTAPDSYKRDDGICIKKEAGKQGKPQKARVGLGLLVKLESIIGHICSMCIEFLYTDCLCMSENKHLRWASTQCPLRKD